MIDKSDSGQLHHDAMSQPRLWGVIVTFRRPEALEVMLARIGEQLLVPDHLLVVDNGSDAAARQAAMSAGADYLDAGENLGPAGGIALGMERVLDHAANEDWVVLFDDDDPPQRPDVLSELWNFAAACKDRDPMTAGVGVVGSRYERWRGVFRRVPDEELTGAVPVDYIGGNQFPMYACNVLRACGVFDRSLFWGFDDAEFGLRLRQAGHALYAHGSLWHDQRARTDRLNLDPAALRTINQPGSWRRYYAVRSTTMIARRYGTPLATAVAAIGGGLRGALLLMKARRPIREILLPVRGACDGLRGRGGRTIDPGKGEKTG